MQPDERPRVGDHVKVTWNPQKRDGVTTTGIVEQVDTGWNSIYEQETTQVTFRDSVTGQLETALLHLDEVQVIRTGLKHFFYWIKKSMRRQ